MISPSQQCVEHTPCSAPVSCMGRAAAMGAVAILNKHQLRAGQQLIHARDGRCLPDLPRTAAVFIQKWDRTLGHRLPSPYEPCSLVFFNLIVSWSYFSLKLCCGEFIKSHLFKSAQQSLRTVLLLQSGDAFTASFSQNQDSSYNVELHFERTA